MTLMKEGPDIASLAALIGDPARANMLTALMSGMALTAGELATEAGITPQTASGHLARLTEGRLITVEIQGRHRYFRLAGPDVAGALEGLMELASSSGHMRTRPGPRDPELRLARICYDHLAGRLGVELHNALIAQGLIAASADGLAMTPSGRARFRAEGIDVDGLEKRNRPLCRACLDWSERRHHLSGPLGAALLRLFIDRRWARRDRETRHIRFSPHGLAQFEAFLKPAPALARAVS